MPNDGGAMVSSLRVGMPPNEASDRARYEYEVLGIDMSKFRLSR